MNSSQSDKKKSTISEKERQIYKLFYQGGLQKFFPRDEARLYVNNLLLDSLKHCVSDFSSDEPSTKERDCVRSFTIKNFQLLNGNLY